MKIENYSKEQRVEIVQSYIVTTARYDFSVYEKRIVYRLVENIQYLLKGEKLNEKVRIDKSLYDLYSVEMPIAALLNGEEDKNYSRTKNALLSMSTKVFQYEDAKEWKAIPLIGYPKIRKYESIIHFKLHEDIYDALLNFSKGFKRFELQTAFTFESVYAMRFYELFSNQRTPLTFSIENLKLMFGVEKKYLNPSDFIRKVVETAKNELDKKSPYSFTYTALKTGRKITSIKFFPVSLPQNIKPEDETERLKKQISPSLLLEQQTYHYLKTHYHFSAPEMKNNITLFQTAEKTIPDLLMFMSEIKVKANRANNPKGYLINALRKKMGIKQENQKTEAIELTEESLFI